MDSFLIHCLFTVFPAVNIWIDCLIHFWELSRNDIHESSHTGTFLFRIRYHRDAVEKASLQFSRSMVRFTPRGNQTFDPPWVSKSIQDSREKRCLVHWSDASFPPTPTPSEIYCIGHMYVWMPLLSEAECPESDWSRPTILSPSSN